jgi:hypothetical protein
MYGVNAAGARSSAMIAVSSPAVAAGRAFRSFLKLVDLELIDLELIDFELIDFELIDFELIDFELMDLDLIDLDLTDLRAVVLVLVLWGRLAIVGPSGVLSVL